MRLLKENPGKMNKKETTYRLPAEWEPQQGVMLTWPHEATDWAPYLEEITQTMVEITRAIARREEVLIVVPHESLLPDEVRQMEQVSIAELPTNDTWARDHGPIVLKPADEDTDPDAKSCWLDFKFNGWGEKFEAAWDNMLPLKIWSLYGFLEEVDFEDHQDFVLEGGSIETDGRGTLFTTSQCLLAPHRNQPLSRDEIEQELKRRLHVGRVVWLDHGNLTGDDTDGHIDTIVRCAPDDTLLYVGCDDETDEQYEDFHALEQQLKALRTADGRPYRLLRLPMPDAISYDGERLPATYANFLVINQAVLVPVYGQEAKDAEALSTIQQAFPDRELVAIDARVIIRQHGSVHCLTMQLPEAAV